jgi:folate-binding protein YgfZ
MLTDMHVLQSESMILLDVPAHTATATLERLDQFLFSEDVRLGSLAESLTGVWIHGPRAASTLEAVIDGATDLASWTDYQHMNLQLAGDAVSVARIDQLGVTGYCVYLDPSRAGSLVSALEASGAVTAGSEALAAARIEAGYPVFGVDMTEDTIPLEAGIENRAISFTKGCYVGQEIIIRVLHRGGGRVAKKLVGLRTEDGAAASGFSGMSGKVYSGDREIGHVTSAATSPRLGSIALAYVHRDFVAPGTVVGIGDSPAVIAATVTERPMDFRVVA